MDPKEWMGIVMLWLGFKPARPGSQALALQSQAKPNSWLRQGFGFGLRLEKPKPGQQAMALAGRYKTTWAHSNDSRKDRFEPSLNHKPAYDRSIRNFADIKKGLMLAIYRFLVKVPKPSEAKPKPGFSSQAKPQHHWMGSWGPIVNLQAQAERTTVDCHITHDSDNGGENGKALTITKNQNCQ
ncbi:hypothetical protein B0H10DRAFT_1950895 [Mycena sp. CBHHK59/15]|nr:hypothetical protein B0H10DRAFT_1950895 [Mycena sp. CBHHK59/15]